MASGFFNNVRVAKENNINLSPIIVVHDSSTSYFPVERLFDMRKFYDEHFTKFCYDSTKITLLFDLLIGKNYEDAVELKTIDEKTIEFSGNANSLLKILDEIDMSSKINVECSMSREELVPSLVTHPIDRFIREKGTSVIKDSSWYTIRLTKLD